MMTCAFGSSSITPKEPYEITYENKVHYFALFQKNHTKLLKKIKSATLLSCRTNILTGF